MAAKPGHLIRVFARDLLQQEPAAFLSSHESKHEAQHWHQLNVGQVNGVE